jgi:hypothetical protein
LYLKEVAQCLRRKAQILKAQEYLEEERKMLGISEERTFSTMKTILFLKIHKMVVDVM